MNKNLLTEFKNRGFFFQCTNEKYLEKLLDNKKISFYIVLIVLLQACMLVA